MRIEQEIRIERPPTDVFAFVTDPARLPEWQPTTVEVRREGTGELALGERFDEVHKALGKELVSTVEVAKYDPPRAFALHIVEGSVPLDGSWTFEPAGEGTLVRFVGEGELTGVMRFARRMFDRQFRGYHRRLKQLLES